MLMSILTGFVSKRSPRRWQSLSGGALPSPVDYFTRARRSHRSVLINYLAVDEYVGESFRILVRFLICRHVAHVCRVEHRNVSLDSGAQNATVAEADARRWEGTHL